MARKLRCHRCRSDDLVLREVLQEISEWPDGLFLDDRGQIVAAGEAIRNYGQTVPRLSEVECQGCGHVWHPRRYFAGAAKDTAG